MFTLELKESINATENWEREERKYSTGGRALRMSSFYLDNSDAEKQALLDFLDQTLLNLIADIPESVTQTLLSINSIAHHLTRPELESIIKNLDECDYEMAIIALGLIKERISCYSCYSR